MTDELGDLEQALRMLPLRYSLALRLRDAGVAAAVICEYLDVDQADLDDIYRLAMEKLCAAQQRIVASG